MNDLAIFIFLLKCFEVFSHSAPHNTTPYQIQFQIMANHKTNRFQCYVWHVLTHFENKSQNNFRTWFIQRTFLVRFVAIRQNNIITLIWIKSNVMHFSTVKISQRKFINGTNSSHLFLEIQYEYQINSHSQNKIKQNKALNHDLHFNGYIPLL